LSGPGRRSGARAGRPGDGPARASRPADRLSDDRRLAADRTITTAAVSSKAPADGLKAGGEGRPALTAEVWPGGEKHREVKTDAAKVEVVARLATAAPVGPGKHAPGVKKEGSEAGL
jgi:hypothetical protein